MEKEERLLAESVSAVRLSSPSDDGPLVEGHRLAPALGERRASPVSALHRDVLHCVFSFLGRRRVPRVEDGLPLHGGAREFVVVASVCRLWRDAADSATGHAEVMWPCDSLLTRIASSPLRSCIGAVDFNTLRWSTSYARSASFRREFAAVLPQLRHLACTIDLTGVNSIESTSRSSAASECLAYDLLDLPPRLQSLLVSFHGSDDAEGCMRLAEAMQDVARLADTLTTLNVCLMRSNADDSGRPPSSAAELFAWVHELRPLTQLRSFVCSDLNKTTRDWSDEAIDALRSLPSLTYIDFSQSVSSWHRLTAEPHSLQLQQLPQLKWWPAPVHRNPTRPHDMAGWIRRLPTLTVIDRSRLPTKCDSALLSHLPALRELRWSAQHSFGPRVAELRTCTQLRTMYIRFSTLTDDQLCEVVPNMPHLSSLTLSELHHLRSLRFLSADISPQLPITLKELHLASVSLPCEELLSHSCPVRSLRSLTQLVLRDVVPMEDLPRLRTLLETDASGSLAQQWWPRITHAVQVSGYDPRKRPAARPVDQKDPEIPTAARAADCSDATSS